MTADGTFSQMTIIFDEIAENWSPYSYSLSPYGHSLSPNKHIVRRSCSMIKFNTILFYSSICI